MRLVIQAVLLFSSLFCFASSISLTTELARERQLLLDYLEEDDQTQWVFEESEYGSQKHKDLFTLFCDELVPMLREFEHMNKESTVLKLLLDRGLYSSEEEKKQWMDRSVQISNRFTEVYYGKEFKLLIKRLYILSVGTKGDLRNLVDQLYTQLKFTDLPEEVMPQLERLHQIEQQVEDVANNSPYANVDIVPEMNEIRRAFTARELAFEQASAMVRELTHRGETQYGNDIVTRAAPQLQEMAEIRTQIAVELGYENWAQYTLDTQSADYSASFKTVDQKLELLYNLLSQTDELYRELISIQHQQLGLHFSGELQDGDLPMLMGSTIHLLNPYFRKEEVEPIWKKTMLESGFPLDVIEAINIDSEPRGNKFTGGYMMPLRESAPRRITVSEQKLSIEGSLDSVFKPKIYIVQNATGDGLGHHRTMFHEGGHALDYSYREYHPVTFSNSSYSETQSFLMETFLADRNFLIDNGLNAEGERLSPEVVDTFISKSIVSGLLNLRMQTALAIFDLELWSVAYNGESEPFIDRARRIYRDIWKRATYIDLSEFNGLPEADTVFSTDHFYNGRVMYFGYVGATLSVGVSRQHVLNLLEQSTGRRSFYQQPGLAEILIEGYYRRGHHKPFPESIEDFTGKPFQPDDYVEMLRDRFEQFRNQSRTCSNLFAQ